MYNQEIKEKFIEEFSNSDKTKKAARALFQNVSQYEEVLEKDVGLFTIEEIEPVAEALLGARTVSQNSRYAILKRYVDWRATKGLDIEPNGILAFKIDENFGLNKTRRQSVSSPSHLQKFLDSFCETEDEKTTDCITRCYFWLAFAGIDEYDSIKIKDTDIAINNRSIIYGDNEYCIYEEAVPTFINCVQLKFFNYKHPNYGNITRRRADGTSLLRGFNGVKGIASFRAGVSSKIANRTNVEAGSDIDLNLTYYRTQLSGIFYRAYEKERAGISPDFMDVAAKFMEGKTYKLDKGRNLPGAKQRRLAKEYMEDYIRWKKAHSI